jgi:hypothetical protein
MSTYLSIPNISPGSAGAQPGGVTGYVLVFKTTLRDRKDVRRVAPVLDEAAGPGRWHVDLEDRDKVLRIETGQLLPGPVTQLLREAGYGCEELPD